jgi:hypothetical protein
MNDRPEDYVREINDSESAPVHPLEISFETEPEDD